MVGIIKSLNINSYKKIARQSFAKSLGFLVIFIIIISAVISLKFTFVAKTGLFQFSSFLNRNLEPILSGLPSIEIKNGILILPKEPYTKEWKGDFALIIEPGVEIDNSIMEKYNNCLLLTQNNLIIKETEAAQGKSKIEIYKLEKLDYLKITPIQSGIKIAIKNKEFSLTPSNVEKFLKIIQFFIWPVLFLWFFFMYSFTKPAQILIFSLPSLIFKARLKATLSYKALLNIGVYAIVPPTCLALVKEILNIKIPFFWFIYSAIYVAYLYFAVKLNKEESEITVQNS